MSSTEMPTEAVALSQTTTAGESDADESLEAIELEDRLVAEQFILQEKSLLDQRHLFQRHKGNDQNTNVLRGGVEKPDFRPRKGAAIVNTTAPECEDFNKLTERGIHSLTHSVTDELSRPMSEVEDDPHFDQTEVSSENCIHVLPTSCRQNAGKDPTEEEGHSRVQESLEVDDFEEAHGETDSNGGKSQKPHSEELSGRGSLVVDDFEGSHGEIDSISGGKSQKLHSEELSSRGWLEVDAFEGSHGEMDSISSGKSQKPHSEELSRRGSLEVDDFEGAHGEIDSISGGKSQKPHSEELSGRILSPSGTLREAKEDQENEDGEAFQVSQELPDEHQPTEMEFCSLSGKHNAPQSDPEEFSTNQNNLEENATDSTDAEVDDAASNLGTLSAGPRSQDDECTRLGSDIPPFYPQQLDPEDIINPSSLEVRIRKAREQQNISLGSEAETIAENRDGISQLLLNLEDTSRSILPDLKAISPNEPTGSSVRAVENGFQSQVKDRPGSVPVDLVDDAKELSENKPGVGEAVLLGALASGVNRPTWFVIRAVLVALVASLFLLLHVAIKSDSWFILLNVLFLIFIAGGLILLLGWYISQIGLVSVEKQMAELNLTSEPQKVESKTL